MTRTEIDAGATSSRTHTESVFRHFHVIDTLRGTKLRNLWGALCLMAAGLVITVLASLYIKASVDTAVRNEFKFTCDEILLNIDARLTAAALVLRSGAALFDASETVSRKEWRTFTRGLRIEQNLPGIQGIGFALLIPRGQLARHVREIRGKGFPGYQVWPAGEGKTSSSIIYLEPFSGRNLRAFGYDMMTEPVRRTAMERARDENNIALSGKVLLVQETGKEVQAGALMYIPVYRPGAPVESIEQRRAAVLGWVYSPYRMTDLLLGTLRGWDTKLKDRKITLQVYDGEELSTDTLLYDSRGAGFKSPVPIAGISRLAPLDFAGHRWTLRFTRPDKPASLADYGSAWLVLFGGTVISLLLFGLIFWWQLSVHFYREQAISAEMVRSSEVRYRRLFEAAKDGILILDAENGMIDDVNPFMIKMLSFSSEQFLGKTIWDIGFFKDIIPNKDKFLELQEKGYVRYEDLPLETADGRKIDVEFVSNVYEAGGRKVIQCNIRDITEHKRAEALRKIQIEELQRWHNVTMDREGRILELKREVNELLTANGKPLRYPSAAAQDEKGM